MKKIYKTIGTTAMMAAFALSASAQQLPNGGLEGEWSPKAPWTSTGNDKYTSATDESVVLSSPEGWMLSHTIGMQGLGATVIGAAVEGKDSESAVKLVNTPNPFMASQIVPGYLTLGTPFCTSSVKFSFAGITPEKNDGGSFGGIKFEYRPDAFGFDYKRSDAADSKSTDQAATVLAYLWKGTWTQKNVPGNIVMASTGSPTAVDLVNRDRNILGIETFEGGDVTKTDDAELIAVVNTRISENTEDWKHFVQEFEYKSASTPEMINIVISAGNYFGAAETVVKDDYIIVDNLKLIYYSRLKSLTVAGTSVELTEGKYEYDMPGSMPAESEVAYELLGHGAKAAVAIEGNKVVVTVSNADADNDGLKEHVYTLNYAAAPSGEVKKYNGYLTVDMGTGDLSDNAPATVEITPTGDGKCNFLLPNLTLEALGGSLGNIEVNDVEMTVNGNVTSYKGHVDGMKLLGGVITANVDVTGTTTAEGKIDMKIDVLWVDQNLPIKVTFKSEKEGGVEGIEADANAPVEYYNLQGVSVNADNLVPGIYVRRQGTKVEKVIVK